MTIDFNPFPHRDEAILLAVVAIAIIARMYIRPSKWMPHRFRRILVMVCYAVLFVALAFNFVPQSSFNQLRTAIKCRYQVWVEPNCLNRVVRFGRNGNLEIVLPTTDDGEIVTGECPADVDVELSKHGRLSIDNATLDLKMLRKIASTRRAKVGPFRVFIWADKESPEEARRTVIQALQDCGCTSLFFVVASPRSGGQSVDYKAIPVQ